MAGRLLIDIFDEVFVKDELEKALLAVRAAQRLLADEPEHSKEVEVELGEIADLLGEATRVLTSARRRFEQLSPRARAAMRPINLRLRRVLVEMAVILGESRELA